MSRDVFAEQLGGLGVVANLDGLLRSTINNQSGGSSARTDFVQQIGGSTARSTILGIRQISGSDVAFLDSRGNLPFEQRFSFAENVFAYYRRSAANVITMKLGGETGCDMGINTDPVANYKNTFGGESGKHTALLRSVSGSTSILQAWNASNSSVFSIFPTYNHSQAIHYFGVNGNRAIATILGATKPITTGTASDTIAVANCLAGDIAIVTATDRTMPVQMVIVSADGAVPFNSTGYNGKTAIAHVTRYT